MKDYTEEEKEQIGLYLCKVFSIPKYKRQKGRYLIGDAFGVKSPIGVFEIVKELGASIESGEIFKEMNSRNYENS